MSAEEWKTCVGLNIEYHDARLCPCEACVEFRQEYGWLMAASGYSPEVSP